jgi:hypothetical protein
MNKWLNLHTQNSITMEFRIEKDSLGEVQVPAKQYWAAQTQRSLQNFKIGGAADKMPLEIIRAFAILKKAAAFTNQDLGVLAADKATLISASTSVSGNTRTVTFVVRPNSNFPTLSGNSISQYASSTNGCDAGWTEVANLFNSAPNSSTSPTSVSAGVTISSVCEGGTIALQGTASGATDWSWVGPNSFTSSSEDPTITSAATAASGTYFLTSSNACGTGTGLFDNFHDGNFTANPVWTGQAGGFSSSVNNLQGTNTNSDDRISTPSTQVYGSWKFDLQLAATGNSLDAVRFHLISSNANLFTTANGYYVKI